jgi:hypothetical protein
MTQYRCWMFTVVFVLMFGFPAMCLLHIMQGKAGCLSLPLLLIAFVCVTMGLSIVMNCCNEKRNTK